MKESLFVILGHFLPPDPPNNQKNQNFKIMKKKQQKNLEILAFYTRILQMMIIWYIVPQKWSVTDRNFYQFGPFFALTTQKIKILKKWKTKNKKNPGIIRILQLYSTNDDHMIYCSSEVKCDWHNFLAIWTFFCPYNPENQNFEKMRKSP